LAFRGEQVYLDARDGTHVEGRVLGLNPDGSLRLGTGPGETHTFRIGEIRLRASINHFSEAFFRDDAGSAFCDCDYVVDDGLHS